MKETKTTKGGMQLFIHNDWTNYDEVMNKTRQIVETWRYEQDGESHTGLDNVKRIVEILKQISPKGQKQIGIT